MTTLATTVTPRESQAAYYPQAHAQASATPAALIIPGLNNSDAHHWQTLWQSELDESERVQLADWRVPDLDKWRAGIINAMSGIDAPTILIGHSFGALAAASIAVDYPEKVAGLFLVAPADPDKFGIRDRLPRQPFAVPSVLIASDNDPWISEAKAAALAALWGAEFVGTRNLGHINSQSNIGVWTDGLKQYQKLIERVQATRS